MDDRFDRGLEVRKAVLGEDYVERSLAGADAFAMPMQRLATEYCWVKSGRDRACRIATAA
jgi:4-carboxymuconolactone decarboxylase